MVDMILFIWRTDVQCTCTYLVRPTDIMARASCRIAMFDKPNKYTSIPVREIFVNAAGLTIDNNAIDVVSHCYRSLIKLLSLVQHTHIQWHTDNTNNKCVWLNTFRILFGGPDGVSCQQEALGNTYEYSIRAHTHILPSRKDYQSRPTRIEKHKNYEKKKTRTERRKCYSNEYIYILSWCRNMAGFVAPRENYSLCLGGYWTAAQVRWRFVACIARPIVSNFPTWKCSQHFSQPLLPNFIHFLFVRWPFVCIITNIQIEQLLYHTQ